MNVFLAVLYGEGFWIPALRGQRLGEMLRKFLLLYQKSACEAVRRGLNRFPLVPKGHMLAHCAEQMVWEGSRGRWVMNPLSMANQQQEDYIGRPSRLSRRVHASTLHVRVAQRSLLASFQALFA